MSRRPLALVALLLVALQAACTASSVTPSGSPGASSTATGSPSGSQATPEPTPYATSAGDMAAMVIDLGRRTGPFDIREAFGSLWVTGHHTNEVIRIDPVSLKIVARITSGPGPGWFAVTDDAIWVTNKNGSGISRIDPQTNELVTSVGTGSPCGPPAVAAGSVWIVGCDTQVIERIDPATNTVVDSIPAAGYSEPILAGDQLFATNADALARLDPTTMGFVVVGGCCGLPFGYDGSTIWLNGLNELTRVDPVSGEVAATLHNGSGATSIAFLAGHAWVTYMSRHQLAEIDLATNQVIGTTDVGISPITVFFAFGALWVTDYDAGNLWKLTP